MTHTCADPRVENKHACPGRCGCYVNHLCCDGCTCNGCEHNVQAHIGQLLKGAPGTLDILMRKARTIHGGATSRPRSGAPG
jgi:hypothetical protein